MHSYDPLEETVLESTLIKKLRNSGNLPLWGNLEAQIASSELPNAQLQYSRIEKQEEVNEFPLWVDPETERPNLYGLIQDDDEAETKIDGPFLKQEETICIHFADRKLPLPQL